MADDPLDGTESGATDGRLVGAPLGIPLGPSEGTRELEPCAMTTGASELVGCPEEGPIGKILPRLSLGLSVGAEAGAWVRVP